MRPNKTNLMDIRIDGQIHHVNFYNNILDIININTLFPVIFNIDLLKKSIFKNENIPYIISLFKSESYVKYIYDNIELCTADTCVECISICNKFLQKNSKDQMFQYYKGLFQQQLINENKSLLPNELVWYLTGFL